MGKLTEYIEKIKKYKEKHPELTEIELIRYIYLDLGSMFSFDETAYFGNGKEKARIYYRVRDVYEDNALEEIMENQIGICKEIAFIYHRVLEEMGVDVRSVPIPEDDYHIYNVIRTQDGRIFSADLQRDIPFIKTNSRTNFFGLATIDDEPPRIHRDELEKIDKKIGYIEDRRYYGDQYYDLLKYNGDMIKDFGEKADYIFENLMIYDNKDLKYFDRMMYNKEIVNILFTNKERSHIHVIDCYYEDNGERDYQTCIEVEVHGNPVLYRFSYEDMKYHKKNLEEFAKEVHDGLIIYSKSKNIKGLREALKRIENDETINTESSIDDDER